MALLLTALSIFNFASIVTGSYVVRDNVLRELSEDTIKHRAPLLTSIPEELIMSNLRKSRQNLAASTSYVAFGQYTDKACSSKSLEYGEAIACELANSGAGSQIYVANSTYLNLYYYQGSTSCAGTATAVHTIARLNTCVATTGSNPNFPFMTYSVTSTPPSSSGLINK